MSPETGQLLILGAVGVSTLANAVTAYVLWRGREPIEVHVVGGSPLFPTNSVSADHAASSGRSAVGSAPLPEVHVEVRLSRDCDGSSRLHAQWQGKTVEVIALDSSALRLEIATVESDLGNGDREVAQVGDFNTAALGSVEQQQPLEPDAKTNGVAADHPVGVDHAKNGAGNGDAEGHPADPVHAAEHSAEGRKNAPPFRNPAPFEAHGRTA